jgi:glucose 1-dehydrogenase
VKAICLTPGTTTMTLEERPEPKLKAADEIKMQVLQVGICGTDRDEAAAGRALAPDGSKQLVLGHEMLGKVVEVGSAVKRIAAGDLGVFTVRRGCGLCLPCNMNRSDMCRTGKYRERGIWGMDGYQANYVVDREQYVVKVPSELGDLGVLTEPLSVAEKAIAEAIQLQSARLPDAASTPEWIFGRRCLVAGLGPIGLLAALALRLRGAEVYGLDVVAPESARPMWLAGIGGHYLQGRGLDLSKISQQTGDIDLIFEATGVAALEFNLMDALATDGVYVLTGIPMGDRPLEILGAQVARNLVLKNQVMLGSVNAARDHYQMAVNDLAMARLRWGSHLSRVMTNRHPYSDFHAALASHGDDEIKVVIDWRQA